MKKGNLMFVSIMFIIVLLLFGIISMVTYNMFAEFDDSIVADLELNESKTIITDVTDRFPSVFDGLILIIFVGIWIAGIASCIVKEEHPLVFGFMMLMIVAVLIAGMFLSNSFEEMFQDSEMSSMPATFPITYWILTHLLEVGIVMMLSVLLTLMAKNRM